MYFNYDSCPFDEPHFCNKNCIFFHNNKCQCMYTNSNDSITEQDTMPLNTWKYHGNLELQESEFYIWDNEKNTYDMIKWEYQGEMLDF